jgi:uncharacterized protein (TIGR02452 family)
MNNTNRQNRIDIANENKKIIITKQLPLNIKKPYKININKKININFKGLKKTKIIFFKGTTNEAIMNLYLPNLNFVVLNFANSKHVGGGYTHGSMAQEEELCRTVIDLFPSLALRADRKHNYIAFNWTKHVLYSSSLNLYRYDNSQSNGKYNMLFTPIKVSVITAAAPDLNNDTYTINLFKKNINIIFDIIYKIIRTICLYPIFLNKSNKEKRINILILGAFGCGAFSPSITLQNSLNIKYNEEIATIFVNVLLQTPNLLSIYDYICFAIPKGDNYNTFYSIFKSYNLI